MPPKRQLRTDGARRARCTEAMAAALLAAALLALVASASHAQQAIAGPSADEPHPAQPSAPGEARVEQSLAPDGVIAVWQPAYTAYLPLPEGNGDVTIAVDGDDVWLATETEVSRFHDGVWQTPQQPPGVTKIFALAPTSADTWAFGLDGGIWRLRATDWSVLSPPVLADLYDAVARSPDDIWAVGFDYDNADGVLVHWDGSSLSSPLVPLLDEQFLYAIAVDSQGEAWAGGCDYTDRLVLLRDGGVGEWHHTHVPDLTGCIYDIAFDNQGWGLAAAGSDLLTWSGTSWSSALVRPPQGSQWVRVAATSPVAPTAASVAGRGQRSVSSAPEASVPYQSGWAVAGTPTWRGYTDGQEPWFYDGLGWRPAAVDYLGLDEFFAPSDANPGPRPYVDLASDGARAVSVCRTAGVASMDGEAALMDLAGGYARFEHPLLESVAALAAPAAGQLWAAGRGAAPLASHGTAWQRATVETAPAAQHYAIDALDMASATAGWALGTTSSLFPVAGEPSAWRLAGGLWSQLATPGPVQLSVRLRALPDDTAWAATRAGQLWAFDGSDWAPLKGAPLVGPEARPGYPGAPFDVVQGPDGPIGCLSAGDGMYRYVGGEFHRVARAPRGTVTDLQLIDEVNGWAIALDRSAAGSLDQTTGVVLRLRDCQATEVPPQLPRRIDGSGQLISDADWQLLAAVSPNEVWLAGTLTGRGLILPALLGASTQWASATSSRGPLVVPYCQPRAIAAAAIDGGTDVWLSGETPCGPNPSGAIGRYAGPVSLLKVRPAAGTVLLPLVAVNAER